MTTVYKCDNCNETHKLKVFIFNCYYCDKEICDSCMFGWGACKECTANIDVEQLKINFDKENF